MTSAALPADLVIRPYVIRVSGFGEMVWFARSRGKALAAAWESYSSYRDDVTFGAFLKLARCLGQAGRRGRFGESIMVGGERAYFVSHDSQYIQFVRPYSDVVLHSHPLDVDPQEARRGTPYYRSVEPAT